MRSVLIIFTILAGVILILWLGIQVKPKSFAPFPQPSQSLETISLPSSLPAPVERFYRTAYGDTVPVIKTVLIEGAKIVTRGEVYSIVFPSGS